MMRIHDSNFDLTGFEEIGFWKCFIRLRDEICVSGGDPSDPNVIE